MKKKIREKLCNFSTVIINVIIMLIIVILMFSDVLFLKNKERTTVLLNSTTNRLYPFLHDGYSFRFELSERKPEEGEALLSYDERFMLYVNSEADIPNREELVREIKKAAIEAAEVNGNPLIRELIKKIREIDGLQIEVFRLDGKDRLITVICTVVYFILVTVGPLLAADVISDRSGGNLEMLLSCLDCEQYVLGRFAGALAASGIQGLILLVEMSAAVMARYLYDGFSGMMKMTEITSLAVSGISPEILLCIPVAVSETLSLQLLLMISALSSRNISQHNQRQTLFYLLALCGYYGLLHYGKTLIGYEYLVLVPLLNMVILPIQLVCSKVSYKIMSAAFLESVMILLICWKAALETCQRKVNC